VRRAICSFWGETEEVGLKDVSIRYALAAIAFGIAALGYILLPVG